MESPNLNQHHLQDQLVGSSTPSGYGAGSTPGWTQNIVLKTHDINLNYNGALFNARNRSEVLIPPYNSSMVQDLGFSWNGNPGPTFPNQSAPHDFQIPKIIKGELSETLPIFSEMSVNSPLSVKNEQMDLNYDLSEKLLLKTISSDFPINGNQSSGDIYTNKSIFESTVPGRAHFSQICPSLNISNINQSVQPSSSSSSLSSISGPFEMNLEALDLLNSTRFSRRSGQHSYGNIVLCKENTPFDPHIVQRPSHSSPYSPSRASSFSSEITETKRPNSLMEPKTAEAAPKKSRLETRAACPPFKVRKEKLGDRIAALQQLVAPFGKTDTASVLMEAIGYIKFLQNQVETLSVPYMKSSRNKSSRTMPTGSTAEDGNEESKRDLRSRGLCLVPLSCMSYVTSDSGGGGGGIWPPSTYGGGI